MHFFFKTNLKMSLFYVLDIMGVIGRNMMVRGTSIVATSAASMICMFVIRYDIGTMAQ